MQSYKNEGKRVWLEQYDPEVAHHLDYPACPVHDLLAKTVQKFPHQTALIFLGRSLNYETLQSYVDKQAAFLIRAGLQAGDRVGILLPNCPQFVIGFYGVLKAGGIVTAINPGFTHDEIVYQIKSVGIRYLICLESIYPIIHQISQSHAFKAIILTELKDMISDDLANAHVQKTKLKGKAWIWLNEILRQPLLLSNKNFPIIPPDQPAIFQFSGGTTGTPKAAIGLHRNLVANTIQFRYWLSSLREGSEVFLAAIPLFHVYGMVIGMSLSILLGASLVLIPNSREIGEILAAIQEYRVSVFPGVPSLYFTINNFPSVRNYDLKTIRACISGSASLPKSVKTRFEELIGGQVLEGYGLSEAPTATHCNPMRGVNKTGSIGLPLPDVDCRIVSLVNRNREVTIGAAGELLIRGPQVMKAYYRRSKETKQALQGGWLHTGDIAKMDEQGYFYIESRKKDLIKVGGLQVWPREIEEVIDAHPAVAESAVAGIPDARHGEVPAAWIILKPGVSLTELEIKNWCKVRLIGYKIPRIIQFRAVLPRTTVGKVLKRELVKMHLESTKNKGGS